MIEHRDCDPSGGRRCQLYWAGHNTHWIHAKQVGRTPWGWRDAVVADMRDGWVTVEYLLVEGRLRLWHHVPLDADISVGSLVRVHEQFYVLGGPFGWLNVLKAGGLGAVPEPASPEDWTDAVTGGVENASTGRALPLDHAPPSRSGGKGPR